MALPRRCEITALLILGLSLLSVRSKCSPLGVRRGRFGTETVFDVTKYGAKADGRSECAMAFIRTWNAACQSGGPAKLLIPQGTFSAGEVVFQGPCTGPKPIIIEIQGTVLSATDISLFTRNVWITIEDIDGVIVTGGGTLNGQGESAWQYADGGNSGSLLPVSLVVQRVNNSAVQNIKLVNSKGFHMKVTDSSNIAVTNLNIIAPATSPNTDGLHISDSQNVNVSSSIIGTGDDCVSVGDGNTNIAIFNITCGPGHGISIGSLGKRPEETDVKGVTVTNCTLVGTTNGARIKTYHDSPQIQASGITFQDIIMDRVKNPIVIDQHYNSRKKREQSKVKISDVHFRNIRGTSISRIAITLNCSQAIPCEGVELANIHLTPAAGIPTISSACSNVKPILTGTLNPAGCQ